MLKEGGLAFDQILTNQMWYIEYVCVGQCGKRYEGVYYVDTMSNFKCNFTPRSELKSTRCILKVQGAER